MYGEKHKMKTSRTLGGLRAEAATRLFSLLHGRRHTTWWVGSRVLQQGGKKSALQHTPR